MHLSYRCCTFICYTKKNLRSHCLPNFFLQWWLIPNVACTGALILLLCYRKFVCSICIFCHVWIKRTLLTDKWNVHHFSAVTYKDAYNLTREIFVFWDCPFDRGSFFYSIMTSDFYIWCWNKLTKPYILWEGILANQGLLFHSDPHVERGVYAYWLSLKWELWSY